MWYVRFALRVPTLITEHVAVATLTLTRQLYLHLSDPDDIDQQNPWEDDPEDPAQEDIPEGDLAPVIYLHERMGMIL